MTPTLSATNVILKQQNRVYQNQVDWLNDGSVMQYSEQRHRDHSLATCRRYVDSFDTINSHIWQIQNLQAEYVGSITTYIDPDNRIADIGILIGKEFWGRGYASEAWRKVSDWLLSDDKIRKIEAGTMKTNIPMQRVFEKTGFKLEGEKKLHFWVNNAPVNLLQYAKFK